MYSPRSSDRLLTNLRQRSDEMSDPNAANKAPESHKLRRWTPSYHTYVHTVPPFERFLCLDKEDIGAQSLYFYLISIKEDFILFALLLFNKVTCVLKEVSHSSVLDMSLISYAWRHPTSKSHPPIYINYNYAHPNFRFVCITNRHMRKNVDFNASKKSRHRPLDDAIVLLHRHRYN